MEAKSSNPTFTVSLRGYDRVEVDDYLDSLGEAMARVDETREQSRQLQAHISVLNSRIRELEERIAADTPRTGAVLGERITMLLSQAEETAAETIRRGEMEAGDLLEDARRQLAEAEEKSRIKIAGGEEQARRIEASARAEATEIIAEAESRATARTRQIEQWAEQVVSHTRAEEARMLQEQQIKKEQAAAELQALADQRDQVAGTMHELRDILGHALGLIPAEQPQVTVTSAVESPVSYTSAAIPPPPSPIDLDEEDGDGQDGTDEEDAPAERSSSISARHDAVHDYESHDHESQDYDDRDMPVDRLVDHLADYTELEDDDDEDPGPRGAVVVSLYDDEEHDPYRGRSQFDDDVTGEIELRPEMRGRDSRPMEPWMSGRQGPHRNN